MSKAASFSTGAASAGAAAAGRGLGGRGPGGRGPGGRRDGSRLVGGRQRKRTGLTSRGSMAPGPLLRRSLDRRPRTTGFRATLARCSAAGPAPIS